MSDEHYDRKIQTSVTNFIYSGDEYLFLKRNLTKRVDPGRLNGVGGRVELGEDFLNAVIRETKEETGYDITPADVQFSGVIRFEGGYPEDWIVCFYKTQVSSRVIPHGNRTDDGELMWLHKDEVLSSQFELVDDLNYCFKDVVLGEKIFFMNLKIDEQEKVAEAAIGRLSR